MQNFWTYAMDGEDYYDAEFESSEQCIEAMNESFAANFEGENLLDGDIRENDAEVIQFRWNDDTGEREILQTQDVVAEYEHYHGDAEEHGTH